ncbi:alanine racemase [Candidatus Regiella insecticola 5.15]|uniref:Alanine racemase n=1 Tax=Candidatus Regiella insecticola 5.15 TaxID=1005043 RepID=G2GWX8_9ENTR|nr:alanine racemase [Candidatus Regiella insecticola]EGY29762.1 alanine racemase [Candidatus Regiella insecticola 5.15]
MPRPISATVHLSALHHNLKRVRDRVSCTNSKIWSVVKANAYGHGLAHVWRYLEKTDGFALLDLNDAVLLREQGWQKPILLLEGFFKTEDLTLIDHYNLTTVVHSDWQLAALENAKLKKPVEVYLKLNSGMNRLGFPCEEAHKIWQRAKQIANIKHITLMSHFANAAHNGNIDNEYRFIQQNCQSIPADCSSLANSAVILWHPSVYTSPINNLLNNNLSHFCHWVRPGIMLYGASPNGQVQTIKDLGLRPAMSLHSELLAVQTLKAGDTVGYGSHYRANEPQRIGIVACGYADGYPRNAPTGTPILVEGVLTKTLGAVSMDMLAVDLTLCPHAQVGSIVELWGNHLPIDNVAMAAGTISYELMCALSARVPVSFIADGE